MALNFQTNRGWTAATLAPQTDVPGSDTPDFLSDAIRKLTELQQNGVPAGTSQSSLVQQILGDENGYLLAPALAAGSFSGGGQGGGLSLAPIQNPLIGKGYNAQAQAQAGYVNQQQEGLRASQMLQDRLLWNPNSGGTADYDPSGRLTRTGQQKHQLKMMLNRGNSAYSAPAGASAASGWAPMPIGF